MDYTNLPNFYTHTASYSKNQLLNVVQMGRNLSKRPGKLQVLTEKGVSLAKKISAIEKRIQTETRSGISDDEMLAFYRTLEKLNGNLRNISHEML